MSQERVSASMDYPQPESDHNENGMKTADNFLFGLCRFVNPPIAAWFCWKLQRSLRLIPVPESVVRWWGNENSRCGTYDNVARQP